MLRQGPVPAFVHGITEYLAGALFIGAPFLFGFDSNTARAFSIVVGLTVLVHTASSMLPTGLAKVIPVTVHAAVDFALSIVLVAAPFLLGFSDEGTPTAFFIVLGALHLLLTIATRFVGEPQRPAAHRPPAP